MVILSVLRVLLEFMLAVAAIASYNFGSDLLCAITGLYFWPVKLIGSCASLSAMCFLLEKIKDVVYFLFKSCNIWMLTHKDSNLRNASKNVALNWKEMVTVVALNAAIRKALEAVLRDKNFENIPKSIQNLGDSKLGQLSKKVVITTTDYADECVLAWCYMHDDKVLKECLNGIATFIKNAGILMVTAIPNIVLVNLLKGVTALGYVWLYINYVGFGVMTIIPAYVGLIYFNRAFYTAILEPFMMASVVHTYVKRIRKDTDTKMQDDLLAKLDGIAGISEIKSLIGGNNFDKSTTEECSNSEDE
jgi:hypothetical protein